MWSSLLGAALTTAAILHPSIARVLLFGLYSIPANSVLPLPHEPGLLYFALLAPALGLALVGALGTFAAAHLDGFIVRWIFRRPTAEALRATRSWQVVTRMLLRAPFLTLFAVAFTGLPPIQAVRLLVLSSGYSTRRYATAVALGRLPRFYLIALLGQAIGPPVWLMFALTVGFLAWPVYSIVRGRLPMLAASAKGARSP